jgi:hypothetical protein
VPLPYTILLIAAAVILAGWLVVAGIRSLRTFIRSFWPH